MRQLLASIVFSCAISACAGSGSGTVTYSGEAYAQPDLVEIEPGVQVIADYDEPVFYSDNYYWRQEGGVWYHSHDYRRGWARADAPAAIIRIDRPQAYVHYHASGTARADVRDHRGDYRNDNHPTYPTPAPGPEVRDHREGSPTFPQNQPDVRDHRDDNRRDERRDQIQPQPQPVQPVQPQPPRAQPQPPTRPPEAMPQRDVRQDDRREQREERKDDKREQRDQRKDEREQRKDDKKRDR